MDHDTIKKVVILFHEVVHYKAKARHYNDIGQNVWDHLYSHVIRINEPEYRVPECPYNALNYRCGKEAVLFVEVNL